MIVELLHKEYRENLGFKKDLSIFKKLLKIFGTLLGLAFFVEHVGLEVNTLGEFL